MTPQPATSPTRPDISTLTVHVGTKEKLTEMIMSDPLGWEIPTGDFTIESQMDRIVERTHPQGFPVGPIFMKRVSGTGPSGVRSVVIESIWVRIRDLAVEKAQSDAIAKQFLGTE